MIDKGPVLAQLVVRRMGSSEEVSRIDVHTLNERIIDRVMAGMMINMDNENFYIDDSEVDAAREKQEEEARKHNGA